MAVSARNQLKGVVHTLVKGDVMAEVVVEISGQCYDRCAMDQWLSQLHRGHFSRGQYNSAFYSCCSCVSSRHSRRVAS